MIRAFLSHSSAQKEFVKLIANDLGNDNCVFDERTFEGGMPLLAEITGHIKNCELFVLFLSNEALDSEWVQKEVMEAREQIENNIRKKRFCVYMIDNTSPDDSRISPWIKDYIIKYIPNPIIISRKIKRQIREIKWVQYPIIAQKEKLIKGREREIGELEEKYYDGNMSEKKVMIASGLNNIGRRKLLSHYIAAKIKNNEAYEPLAITMESHSSIEDFIMQLNNYTLQYNNTELLEVLEADKETKVNKTIELINEIVRQGDKILIRDQSSCILSNGVICDWMTDIITHPHLINELSLFITSAAKPQCREFREVISICVPALNKSGQRVLFNAYAHLVLSSNSTLEKHVNQLIDKFSGFPGQILYCVDSIKEKGLGTVMNNLDRYLYIMDGSIRPIVNHFFKDEKSKRILVLLSKFEYISYDALYKIVDDEPMLTTTLEEMFSMSIVENIGSFGQYIKLNSIIRDFIDRLKQSVEQNFTDKIKAIMIQDENTLEDTSDLSSFLFTIIEGIKNQSLTKTKFLIPSFFLRTITKLYYEKNYEDVVNLCEQILYDNSNKDHYYKDVVKDIYFTYCLALARLKREARFFEEIQHVEGVSRTYLEGFYYRCVQDYPRSERKYEEVLSKVNKPQARRELVLVKYSLKKYPEALKLAQKNYEENSSNPFHIEAYFKCLARYSGIESNKKQLMSRLIREIEEVNSQLLNRAIIQTLKAEYKFYACGDITRAIDDLKQLIDEVSPKYRYYPKRSLREIFEKQGISHSISRDTEEPEEDDLL